MNKNVKIEIDDDHVAIIHKGKEIVGWNKDEWNEDPSIVPSIANAILLGATDVERLKKILSKFHL